MGARIAFGFIIVLTILMLIMFAVGDRTAQPEPATTQCMDTETRQRVRGIVLEGVDQGLRDHIKGLFNVWATDPKHDQPKRAITGMNNGLAAYFHARAAALKWAPPEC
jgi:hypothetical protein